MDVFVLFAGVGFLAQIVDGALGMAYGVVSSTVLLSFGVPPAQASASVHAAELFTTAASGASHVSHRNVEWRLLWPLAAAGIVGGVLGTYVITGVPAAYIKPFVVAYLLAIGLYILTRAVRPWPAKPISRRLAAPTGLLGGFMDAIGGGGWGPIVTSSLIGAGGAPRYVIGTVNTAEFLVTAAISAAFVAALVSGHWEEAGDLMDHGMAVAGLIAGGVAAAPIAGYAVKHIPTQVLAASVGTLIVTLGIVQALRLWG
ncbi:MAG: TSUP family transporter [Alphaproteobacteria bacterium]|nr:TSUP family transporter [Alphaproteobacteria bacterium]